MLLNFEETKDTCEEHIKIIINIASAKCSKHDNLTFYFNQFLHYLLNQNFKNLILIRFKGIEANYLYVLSNKLHLKNQLYEFFKTFHNGTKPCDRKKASDNPKKKTIQKHD